MDEINKLNKLKNCIEFFVILFLVFFAIISIIIPSEFRKITYGLSFDFFLFLVLPQIIAYFFLKMKYRNSRNIPNTLSNITREISKDYSPALCSLVFNKKVEAYSDYTATILYLEQKGYIKIDGNENNYSIIDLQKDTKNLNNHEKYVYECICNNKNFDINDFKKTVVKDALDMDLIKENRKERNNVISGWKAILMIFCVVFFTLAVIFLVYFIMFKFPTLFIILIISMKWINIKKPDIEKMYTMTKEGKKLQNHVVGFRNYIKEYTLLSEREMKEKEIFEEYIAYALSLGEGKTVEKFVSKNEQYRNLIYKKDSVK